MFENFLGNLQSIYAGYLGIVIAKISYYCCLKVFN